MCGEAKKPETLNAEMTNAIIVIAECCSMVWSCGLSRSTKVHEPDNKSSFYLSFNLVENLIVSGNQNFTT